MRNTLFRAIGHDLRTPLIEVRRVARLLDDPSSDLETHRSTLANDLDALTHRFGLVLNNLMALDAQLTDGATTQGPSALAEAIENVLELHQRDAERKGIDLRHELGDEVLVAVHREMLIAVLDNLLSNAVKFSPQGSTVTISTALTATSVAVSVRDAGPGIAPEAVRRFERGEPLPPASGTAGERGVGIGLGVVRRLLKDVGSAVILTPAHPSGTLARFTLPRYRRSTPT